MTHPPNEKEPLGSEAMPPEGENLEELKRIPRRRLAREVALKMLFQVDVGKSPLTEVLESYQPVINDEAEAPQSLPPDLDRYARKLVIGTARHLEEIDALLEELTEDWSLERLASVDRNILRLATYEILYEPKVPPSVSIDEAVELAKKYSTGDSGRFVNGVLAALVRKKGLVPPS